MDVTENDKRDTTILNEMYLGRVDVLITEDRGLARKAARLGVADRLFTIDAFLEKVIAENPALVDYRVLSVRKVLFAHVNPGDTFFDSFRAEYPDFGRWFYRKSQEPAYVCLDGVRVAAFLYLKVENQREPYHNIQPVFTPKKRLKIGTLKVELNVFKLGERFLKIVFDNAIVQRVDEIYVTIFPHSIVQQRLIQLLEDFGFRRHGEKRNPYGTELVYVRDMAPASMAMSRVEPSRSLAAPLGRFSFRSIPSTTPSCFPTPSSRQNRPRTSSSRNPTGTRFEKSTSRGRSSAICVRATPSSSIGRVASTDLSSLRWASLRACTSTLPTKSSSSASAGSGVCSVTSH